MDKINTLAAYVPPNIQLMVSEWEYGTETGEPSRVNAMDEVFAWKRGFVNGWYGWSNDGKGTFFDFMSLIKSKIDGWKWLLYKQEDMSSRRNGKVITITADDIYNNLAWALTGQTPYRHFAKKHFQKQLDLEKYMDAIEWIEKHFMVVNPNDRRFKNVMDTFLYYYEKFGVDGFLIDPWKSIITDRANDTIDQVLNNAFIECKEFALKTDTSFNIIAHPTSMQDVKTSNKEGAPYKVVNQFMISGGAAWDNNMNSQYSIYRPERHLSPSDPKVHFINLKQRKAEIVGAKRGVYENIKFDFLTKRYFFDGVCPIDGSIKPDKFAKKEGMMDFGEPKEKEFSKLNDPDEVPF
jgi:hypothetical protein